MDVPYLHIIACAILAVIGASFSAMDREFKVKAFFYHAGLAAFLGGMCPVMQKAVFPTYVWYICTFPSFLLGFCVYGIAIALKTTNSSVEKTDLFDFLKDRLTKRGGQS